MELFFAAALLFGPQAQTLEPGSAAPDFDLPGVDGRRYSLKDFAAAKALVVIFTCNHCPTAQAYEERIKKLADDARERGAAVVAINPNDNEAVRLDELGYTDLDDSFESMKVRAKDRGFNFPYLDDGPTQAAAKAYGPAATPHAFLFDADRKLRYAGRIDDSEREETVKTRDLRDAIGAVLEGREIGVKRTKVTGCSIKWSSKRKDAAKHLEQLAAEKVALEPADAEALRALRAPGGRLRLVNVWATTCGPCVAEFPGLVRIHRMYRQRRFELVTVAAHFPDEEKEVLEFLQKQQASCRNIIFGDRDQAELKEAFDAQWSGAVPFTLLLAPSGDVLYRREGPVDELELRRAIVKALKRR